MGGRRERVGVGGAFSGSGRRRLRNFLGKILKPFMTFVVPNLPDINERVS